MDSNDTPPHPLSPLSIAEAELARDLIKAHHRGTLLHFRLIELQEPPKAQLVPFLELEHAGKLTATTERPDRLAQVHYNHVEPGTEPSGGSGKAVYVEALVNLETKALARLITVGSEFLVSLCTWEFDHFLSVCTSSPLFQNRIAQFQLPPGFEIVVEPWPYGGLDAADPRGRRFFQGLVFAVDKSTGNPDSNFYAFPLPIIPVMDYARREIVRIDELPTGGGEDPLVVDTPVVGPVVDHCRPAEYVPELIPGGTRTDLKPLSVVQPEGPSFAVSDGNLVEWQKWRFRVGFNGREGAVIHDIHYGGRSVLYRLAMSEMVRNTVPLNLPP
jgi:primary-amine oxidase